LSLPKPNVKKTKRKPTGDREDHQRLANDIIKYNSHLVTEPPIQEKFAASPRRGEPKPRPKSSSDLEEEMARSSRSLPRAASPPVLLHSLEEPSHPRLEPPRRGGASAHLSKSNTSSVSQLTVSQPGGDPKERRSVDENSSEIGIDFDVDRAFRRNRSLAAVPLSSLLSPLVTLCRRKWELLEGMVSEGSAEGIHIHGESGLHCPLP
jgi:hypothetical protein